MRKEYDEERLVVSRGRHAGGGISAGGGSAKGRGQVVETRIMLVDDNYIVRDGMFSILGREAGVRIVASADRGTEAISKAVKETPHIVFMDVALAGGSGVDVTRELVARLPLVKVIGLSVYLNGNLVRDMFHAGAAGYVWKDDAAPPVLMDAIKTVSAGRLYLSTSVVDMVVTQFLCPPAKGRERHNSMLTQREIEVLKFVSDGYLNKEIAERMKVAVRTIERHRYVIMKKLDLHSQAELTKYAVRSGLSQL